MPDLNASLALIAAIFMASALASALIERAPISFPMIFLGLGFLLGPGALGIIAMDAHDRTLEAIATICLMFVLFLDAVSFERDGSGRSWLTPVLALGPGTLLTIALVTLSAWALLNVPPIQALMLGTILSSTDAVVLRDVIRDRRLPGPVREALKIEAGANDLVVLPLLLVLIAVAQAQISDLSSWLIFFGQVFIVGPVVGFAIGGIGSWLVGIADARMQISRVYQSLFGVGLVLAAYASAVAFGGDGFLAAFAAGLAVVVFNRELCDCFLEYGEVTAEIAMLVAFVLFGAVLSSLIWQLPLGPVVGFSALTIFIARPFAFGLVLMPARLSRAAHLFISWFGPRGLNSLLFALLVVHSQLPFSEMLLAIVGVVVVMSVVAHGVTGTPLAHWYARQLENETLDEARESTATGLFQGAATDVPRITPRALSAALESPEPPIVLDVHARPSRPGDQIGIPGSISVPPDQVARWGAEQPSRGRLVVTYCT
ncbi:MAG: cation:proton antiporter [Chloroflexota bacterium]